MGIKDILSPLLGKASDRAGDALWAFTGTGVPEGEEDTRTLKEKILGGDGSKGERLSDSEYYKTVVQARAARTNTNLGPVKPYNMYADSSHLYSGPNRVSKLFVMENFTWRVRSTFLNELRDELVKIDPFVEVSLITNMKWKKFEFGGGKWKSIERTWQNSRNSTLERANVEDTYEYQKERGNVERNERRAESVLYFKEAQGNKGLWDVSMLLVLKGVRGEDFDRCERIVKDIGYTNGVSANPVDQDLTDILAFYSPAVSIKEQEKLKRIESPVPMASEHITQFTSAEQGSTGDRGICMGLDVKNSQPVMKVFKERSTSAENIGIFAATGAGKSYLVKAILLQLIQFPEFTETIIDVEGFEYVPLVEMLNEGYEEGDELTRPAMVLNVGSSGGRYLNSMDLTLVDEAGKKTLSTEDIYNLREVLYDTTLSTFRVLLEITVNDQGDIVSESEKGLMATVTEAVEEVYRRRGVEMNEESTWYKSKGLRYHDVYNLMLEWAQDMTERYKRNDVDAHLPENQEKRLNLVRAVGRLKSYLDEGGASASRFKTPYSLSDITRYQVLVLSMGMAGKATQGGNKIVRSLIRLNTSTLVTLRTLYAKSQGKYTVKLWEEFQRWSEDHSMDSLVKTAFTGGRKMGEVNIVLSNDVGALLDDDRFSIMNNLVAWAIGAQQDVNVVKNLVDVLRIPSYEMTLMKIRDSFTVSQMSAKSSGGDDGDEEARRAKAELMTSPREKAFLVYTGDRNYSESKMLVSDELARSKFFNPSPKDAEDE